MLVNLTLDQSKFIKVLHDSFVALSEFDPGIKEFYLESRKNEEISDLLKFIENKISMEETIEVISNYIKLGFAYDAE